MKRLLLLLILSPTLLVAQPVTLDETARFLAGMPVNGALAQLTNDPAWQEHASAMEEAWGRKSRLQIAPISAWMAANAPDYYESTGTMYYMFSGPDFLYANVFFPHANQYILAGLEPIGTVPDLTRMSPEQLRNELAGLRGAMSTILKFQYFITKDMRADMSHGSLTGTLPMLYVFLARLGYTIVDATHVSSPAEGVKIDFTNGHGTQTLFYFKTDLSGGGGGFLKWCAARGPGLSLLKAASYLMHGDGFSGVRNFLLEHSRVIVQDDSGIPLRAFPKNWTVNVYGRYVPHKEMFDKYWQPDLAKLYEQTQPGELGFAFGYHWQKERGLLMVATRQEVRRAEAAAQGANAETPRQKTSRRSRGAPR